jgi:hypothetical protein
MQAPKFSMPTKTRDGLIVLVGWRSGAHTAADVVRASSRNRSRRKQYGVPSLVDEGVGAPPRPRPGIFFLFCKLPNLDDAMMLKFWFCWRSAILC